MSAPSVAAPSTIRRLTAADHDVYRALRLHALEYNPEAFGSTHAQEAALPRSDVERRLDLVLTVGAFIDGKLVGIASMVPHAGPKDAHKGHLVGMYVHLDYRRHGLGRALVAAIVDGSHGRVEQLLLSVTRDNAAAQRLYRQTGFETFGIEPRALKGPDGYADEILMMRVLAGAGGAEPLTLYGDPISGNCLKVKWVAEYLGLPMTWRTCDVRRGETRSPEFLAINPDGRVPTVVLADGRVLAESNAIIAHLAAGSDLVPTDSFQHAKMLQWMFWEQYSHEPYIAVRRFLLAYLGRPAESLDPKLLERGTAALGVMQRQLAASPFLAGDELSLADVALVSYTRVCQEGGFDLAPFPAIRAWIREVEARLGIEST